MATLDFQYHNDIYWRDSRVLGMRAIVARSGTLIGKGDVIVLFVERFGGKGQRRSDDTDIMRDNERFFKSALRLCLFKNAFVWDLRT